MITTAVAETLASTTQTEVSTDSIEAIISSAINSSAEETDKLQIILSALGNKFKDSLPSIALAAVIFILGVIITRIILRLFSKFMGKTSADVAATSFLRSLLKILLYIINIIITLSILNIPMTSIIAVLSAAGLAVGLALQNSLSNLAGGFIILFSKPFKAGDFVETNSASGTVQSISILYTKILTLDNKTVYIPNGKVADSQITNYSEQDKRRVDMEFGISYSDDVERAKDIILKLATKHELILNEPEPPFVRLGNQAEDSLQIIVRVWTATENYWQVKFDFIEMVNNAFNENHITIPFRQLDVHIS